MVERIETKQLQSTPQLIKTIMNDQLSLNEVDEDATTILVDQYFNRRPENFPKKYFGIGNLLIDGEKNIFLKINAHMVDTFLQVREVISTYGVSNKKR